MVSEDSAHSKCYCGSLETVEAAVGFPVHPPLYGPLHPLLSGFVPGFLLLFCAAAMLMDFNRGAVQHDPVVFFGPFSMHGFSGGGRSFHLFHGSLTDSCRFLPLFYCCPFVYLFV